MIANISQSGIATYGIQEYAIDTPDDISSLPTDIPMGSTALIISTSEVYMLNGSKKWVKIGGASNSGGSGSGSGSGSSGGGCCCQCGTFIELTEEDYKAIAEVINASDIAKDLDFVKDVRVNNESIVDDDKVANLSSSGSSSDALGSWGTL